MDPRAVLDRFWDKFNAGDYFAAMKAADVFHDWLDRGGYDPRTADERERMLAALRKIRRERKQAMKRVQNPRRRRRTRRNPTKIRRSNKQGLIILAGLAAAGVSLYMLSRKANASSSARIPYDPDAPMQPTMLGPTTRKVPITKGIAVGPSVSAAIFKKASPAGMALRGLAGMYD